MPQQAKRQSQQSWENICTSRLAASVMGADQWVDRMGVSSTFWSEGDALYFVPHTFCGRYFCTNAHGIHWMIEAIFDKFSQLILKKII